MPEGRAAGVGLYALAKLTVPISVAVRSSDTATSTKFIVKLQGQKEHSRSSQIPAREPFTKVEQRCVLRLQNRLAAALVSPDPSPSSSRA